MTVNSTTSRVSYAGNGSTTAFSVPFYFLAAADLVVIRTASSGAQTTLVLNTDYTVTGAGVPAGGTVTCTTAPSSSDSLVIFRDPATTQLTDYQANDPFPAETHERALDKLTMLAQRMRDLVTRSFRLSDGDTTTASTTLPSPQANNVIGWNATATGLQNVTPQTLATIVSTGTTVAQTFTGNGTQTSWTLSSNPGALANLNVSIGGVTQVPGVDYLWSSGTTLTTTSAVPSGVTMLVRYTQALPQGTSDSASAAFLQAGVSAVQRTAQDKLRDAVNVRDFGAVGNNVADDTAAIQAALTSLAASGGVVWLPRGVYRVSSPITVAAGVSLCGEGIGVSVLNATLAYTASQPVLSATNANYCQFEDFSIVGNTNGTNGAGSGIYIKNAQGCVVNRVWVSNTTQAGIRLEEVNTTVVDSCWLESCGRTGYTDNHGIMLYSTSATPCYSVKITNNTVRNTFRKGITTLSSTADLYDLLIQGNTVIGSGLGNIYLGGATHREIQIIGNYCSGGYVNIQFGEAKNSVVTDNVCIGSTADFGMGFYGLQNCVIANNTIKNSWTTGIRLFQPAAQTCDTVAITGNTVMNSNRANGPDAAIQVQASSRCMVANNIIFDESGAIRATYGVVEIAGCDFNQVQGNLVFNMSAANYLLVGSNSSLQEVVAGSYFNLGSGFKVNHTSLTLSNGTNNNVALPANTGTVTVTGPTAAYEITGIAGGVLGRQIKLVNSTAQTLTLRINSGSSSAGNRLYLTGSVDKTIAAWSAVSLTYLNNQGSNFWMDV